jgi:immunity protein 48 of polymorphic toxin system
VSDLKALRAQSAKVAGELFAVLGVPFEDTTELQRQLLAAFSFGMLFALGRVNKLTPPEIHTLSICLLMDAFKYSDRQATAFTEDLIESASSRGNPTTNAVIHRGIDAHREWEKGLRSDLKRNLEDIFRVVGA